MKFTFTMIILYFLFCTYFLTGNYADVDPFGFDKGLYVQSGGVFEIHGEEKLSWTKLTQTAYKPSVDQGNAVVEQLVNIN